MPGVMVHSMSDCKKAARLLSHLIEADCVAPLTDPHNLRICCTMPVWLQPVLRCPFHHMSFHLPEHTSVQP